MKDTGIEIGPEVRRAIVDKYRVKLEGLLKEHEFICDQRGHMSLLIKLCEIVESDLKRNKPVN